MGHHRPEATQRGGRHLDAQLGNVAFEERAPEVLMPLAGGRVGARQRGARKPAPPPQPGQLTAAQFREGKTRHVDERHAAGEALAALLDERRRSAAENEETRRRARAVCQYAQQREQVGPTLHLVENHEAAQATQHQLRVGEASEVGRRLEIEEMHGLGRFLGQLPGQRRLARLARADQRHDGVFAQTLADGLEVGGALDVHIHAILKLSFRFARIKSALCPNCQPGFHPPELAARSRERSSRRDSDNRDRRAAPGR
jgi:hypothetical protein